MIKNLEHYLKTWQLTEPHLLADTFSSRVYTVQTDTTPVILKILKPIGEEERKGAVALRCFDGRGAVRLLREDEQAHLLEYASGDDLIGMVKSGEDVGATSIIAEVLNGLHQAPRTPEGLTPLRRWFRDLFERAEKEPADSIYRRGAAIAQKLIDEPRDERVLHGDIHHANIRYLPERGWLAFDPKGLYGERTYDAANTLCNPIDMPDLVLDKDRLLRNATILAEKLNLDWARLIAFTFAYACLSAAWSQMDGMDDPLALGVAEMTEDMLDR